MCLWEANTYLYKVREFQKKVSVCRRQLALGDTWAPAFCGPTYSVVLKAVSSGSGQLLAPPLVTNWPHGYV